MDATNRINDLIAITGHLVELMTQENAALRETIRDVPLERLLVETDSPYLAPVPKRGKPNEPAFVVHTADFLADLKGVASAELAAVTTANFHDLFRKAAPPSGPTP